MDWCIRVLFSWLFHQGPTKKHVIYLFIQDLSIHFVAIDDQND